ncbi:MAG: NUDIX domain-containing protein [Anaerolineales bacterium]|nr:NUDIX domain-containing protein [Anaerolineales bacterium]
MPPTKNASNASSYEESYLGQVRKLVGKRKIIVTAARAAIRDPEGRILFIRRSDNGLWAMPAGSQELDESILDCLKREVWEETGLQVISAIPMAIYSRLPIVTVYGDPYHLFLVQFLVDEWCGELVTETDETVDARFFALDEIPAEISPAYHEALQDLREYAGALILK